MGEGRKMKGIVGLVIVGLIILFIIILVYANENTYTKK